MADPPSVAGPFGPNDWLVDDMYEQYVADPSSVSESWRDFFADYKRPGNGAASSAPAAPSVAQPDAVPAAAPAPPASPKPRDDAARPAAAPSAAPERPATPAQAGEQLRGAAARIVANMESSLKV